MGKDTYSFGGFLMAELTVFIDGKCFFMIAFRGSGFVLFSS